MASKEFRAAKKSIKNAIDKNEVRNIVLNINSPDMEPNDWALLVKVISKATRRLEK